MVEGCGNVLHPKHPSDVNIRVAHCVLGNPVTDGGAANCAGDSTSESVDDARSVKPMSPSHNECGGAGGSGMGDDDDDDEDAEEVEGSCRHIQREPGPATGGLRERDRRAATLVSWGSIDQ